jgi:putative membrane protein
MNLIQIIPLADRWGMHDGGIGVGWLIVMVPMVLLMMGGTMWMMMRGMGGGSPPGSSAPGERAGATESPVDVLERRLADGEISIQEYRAPRGTSLTARQRNAITPTKTR